MTTIEKKLLEKIIHHSQHEKWFMIQIRDYWKFDIVLFKQLCASILKYKEVVWNNENINKAIVSELFWIQKSLTTKLHSVSIWDEVIDIEISEFFDYREKYTYMLFSLLDNSKIEKIT